MPITRTPIIDDSGSGQDGTVIDNAWKQELYNQIDAFTGGAGWQTATPIKITDDAGTVLTTTISLSRTQRLASTTLIWQCKIDAVTVPIATNALWVHMPFTAATLQQVNGIALSSFGSIGYIDLWSGGGHVFRLKRHDLANIGAGTHYAVFSTIWEVLP